MPTCAVAEQTKAPEQAHYPQHEVVAHGLQAPARMNPALATAGCSHVVIVGIRFLQRLKQRSLVDVLVRLGPWHRLPRSVALPGPAWFPSIPQIPALTCLRDHASVHAHPLTS
ncbi:MAG: hypothetical protein ACPIOQ_85415, partial [Promethearchaeia archaeon]